MKLLLALVVIAFGIAGCGPEFPGEVTADPPIYFWHDDVRGVGCWIYASGYKGGISCLPDAEYAR